MHSLVARLRGRAVSQTTTTSLQSDENVPPTPDTPTLPHDSQIGPRSPVDQKILPQVHELMDSFSAVDTENAGLSPPPMHRQGSGNSSASHASKPGPSATSAEAGRSDSPGASEYSSLRQGRMNLSRFSQRVASSGVWSTFGRHNAGVSPRSSRIDQRSSRTRFTFGSVDTFAIPRQSDISRLDATRTVASSISLDQYGRPSLASESPSALPVPSDISPRRMSFSLAITHDSPGTPDEPTNEYSISPDTTPSRQNSTKRSVTTHSSLSSQSQSATVHTPLMQTFDFTSNSPHTFGQTSPGQSPAFIQSGSPPPPLPPLNHPELVASMTSRSQPMLRNLSNVATPPPHLPQWDPTLHAKTYPPRRRRRKTDGSTPDENSIPFPHATRRMLRAYASLPRVRQLFQPDQRSRHGSSHNTSRRSSAEWSAHQATSGVLSNDLSLDFGWPAAVSKEIVRLSLGGDATGNFREATATSRSVDPDITHRVRNLPAGSGETGRPCSPLLSLDSTPAHQEGQSPSLRSQSTSLTRSIIGQTSIGDEQPRPPTNADNSVPSGKPVGVAEVERGMNVGDLGTLSEDGDNGFQSATLPRPARTPRKSILRQSSSAMQEGQEAGSSTNQNVKSSTRHPARHSSEPTLPSVLETPPNNKGKRKAEEIDITPPDQKHHATFVIPVDRKKVNLPSEPSHAPSAYQRKRVRLSSSSPFPSPGHSRPGSAQNASNTGSTSNRSSVPPSPAARAISRASGPASTRGSARSVQQSIVSGAQLSVADSRRSRRSHSESSIPVGAILAAHPPSLSRSSTYHMRDPRRPPRVQSTPWSLRFRTEDEDGSPLHAWCFFIGFILFPIWWVASFWRIPMTRRVGGTDTEKAVTLDDPQVEQDARSWRFRCRIMSAISLFTYIPFIVLVAIFAPR